jgi:glycerol uptake facilitator-like aquaporin
LHDCEAESSTDALQQLWVFILFPLVGAAVGGALFRALTGSATPAE